MPVPPSIDNYTVPGGVKLFFDDGTGERDLGNITDLDIETGTEELEHFSNRSGKRLKDKIIVLEEKLNLKFKFDEPVIENLRYYFKGGDLENVTSGTGTKSDLKLILTGTLLHSVGQYYGLSGVTVRQFLDKVFRYDGAAFIDHSAEADTEGGTPFDVLVDADDILYLGKNTRFKEVYADLAVNGSYTGLTWEYWDGDEWKALAVAGAGANLAADGPVTFTLPADWARTAVNGQNLYWIRAKATAVTTAATVNCFRQNLTQNTDWVADPGQAGAAGRLPGRIGRLATGKIVDGEEVKVNFTYATWEQVRFPIAGASFVEGSARLEVHPDAGRGLRFDVVVPKCLLKPNGAIGLDDKKWLEVPMMLEALDDSANTPDAPFGYYVSYENAA
ncbi:MAG: hypothetical protein QME75_05290 [Deltaproteobacteria bacterium]|nr:hypothetical protein [Deltaproteobacteria bacterium]